MSTTTAGSVNPQAIFYQQYELVRRDEVVGVLLALFLGTFGVHHFYLRRTGLGILYCCFCWTSIPTFLGFIECFFMPGRVREYNAMQAVMIASSLGIPVPGWSAPPVNMTPMNAPGPGTPPAEHAQQAPGLVAQDTLKACPRCQHANPEAARFCIACGAAL